MKTTYKWLTTALILLCSLAVNAQPEWQWGKRGGSSGSIDEEVIDMATDQNGNVYVLAVNGKMSPANVGGHAGIGPGDQVSLASWNCEGNFRWMKTFGGDLNVLARAIGVDTLGGVYVTGVLNSQIGPSTPPTYFDTDTVLPFTRKKMYLIKYDTSGNFQWLKMPEPDTIIEPRIDPLDMDVAPNGEIYLYSLLRPGSLDAGAFIVPDTGMYVWKTDKNGVYQSLTKLDITVSGTPSHAYGYPNLSTSYFNRDHESGNYLLSGKYNSLWGTLSIGTTAIERETYIARFNSSGAALWAKSTDSGPGGVYINSAPIPAGNAIYIGGFGPSGNSLFDYTLVNTLGPSSVPFIFALDSNGNKVWASNGYGDNAILANPIKFTNNTVALGGNYGGLITWQGITKQSPMGMNYIFLARFNAATGSIIGLDSIRTNSLVNNASAMTADKNGNFYLGGRFQSALFVAGDTLFNTGGSYDWFVAKFGTANCNCTIPSATFSYAASGAAINFSYTGSTDYTSISWDFGDGTTAATANPTHTFSDTTAHTVCVTVTNDCGSNVYCLEVTAPTGIESMASAAAVQVYPNPANSSITVEGAGSGTKLMLYEVTGKLALEQTLRNSRAVTLNISHLPDGIYLLQFTDSKGRKGMTKVVKR